MTPPASFSLMFGRVLRAGAFTTMNGDTMQGIAGKRIIIDRVSYSVQAEAGADLTLSMSRWVAGAGAAFWSKIIPGGTTVSGNEEINIILPANATMAPLWSDGISGYFLITWRLCDVS